MLFLKNNKTISKILLFFLIVFLAAILRFWHLSTSPPGLYWDEASNGYNAYSILKTSKDEYGKFLPLSFRAFNDWRPALGVYPLVPSIAVFGLNEFGVRFPAALLGTLTVALTFFLVKKLLKDEKVALLTSFFLAISPWHIQFTHAQFEAGFMLFFSLLALLIYLLNKEKLANIIASAVVFGVALNSYQGAKVWIPIFLLTILIFNLKSLLKLRLKLIFPLLILFIFTLPFLLDFKNTLVRGSSVSIFKNSKQPFRDFVHGYLSHYSPNFLFISGDSIGRHSVTGMGELYVFEIPLIIFGLYALVNLKSQNKKFLIAWLLLAPIPASISAPTPHALRAITFLPLWSIIGALGFYKITALNIPKVSKMLIITTIGLIGLYNVSTYLHLYYKHYPIEKALDWQYGYKQIVSYVNSTQANYDTIAFTKSYGQPYIFVLFYTKYDPAKYHLQSENKDKLGKIDFFPPNLSTIGRGMIIQTEDKTSNNELLYQVKLRDDVIFEARKL